MRNRYTQRKDIPNGRDALRYIRSHTNYCTFCPPNHGENSHGSHSLWGRKVAAKRLYATGKGRKEFNWYRYGPYDLTDKRYWPKDLTKEYRISKLIKYY